MYAPPDWYNSAWDYREELLIDSTKVAADLTDFVLYFDLSDFPSGHKIWSNLQSGGQDLRFTFANGEDELALEVVSVDTSGKTGEVHVKFEGTLSSTDDTRIYVYFGNSNASAYADTDPFGTHTVWNSNYKGVFHLEEDPGGGAPQMLDSTSNDNDGTSAGSMTSGDSIAAQLGLGLAFDGINDEIDCGGDASLDLTGDYTVQAWMRSSVDRASNEYILTSYDDGNTPGIAMRITGTENLSGFHVPSSAWEPVYNSVTSPSTYNDGNWHSAALTFESGTGSELFVDGASVDTDSTTTVAVTSFPRDWHIGDQDENVGSSRPFEGDVDEVRLVATNLSSTWISTEYNNQNSPSTFITSEGTEHRWHDGWNSRTEATIQSSEVDADLTDYPAYFDFNILDSEANFWGRVASGGIDIRVLLKDGTEVPVEVVNINTVGKKGEIHYKYDGTLSSSDDSTIYIYYDNENATLPAEDASNGREAVWNTDYKMVMHLGEAVNTDANGYLDSTSNDNDGTGVSMALTEVSGQLGTGQDFDGSADTIGCGIDSSLDLTTAFTVSCWFNQDTKTNGDILIGKALPAASDGWLFFESNGKLHIQTGDGTTWMDGDAYGATTYSTGAWHWASATYDGSDLRLYLNGSQDAIDSTVNTLSTTTNEFEIAGYQTTAANYYNGKIEEVRILDADMTATWISTEYNNQDSPSTFYSLGPTTTFSDDTLDYEYLNTENKFNVLHEYTSLNGCLLDYTYSPYNALNLNYEYTGLVDGANLLYQFFPALHKSLSYEYESNDVNPHNLLYQFYSGPSAPLIYQYIKCDGPLSSRHKILYQYFPPLNQSLLYEYKSLNNHNIDYQYFPGLHSSLNYEYLNTENNKNLDYQYTSNTITNLLYEYIIHPSDSNHNLLYEYLTKVQSNLDYVYTAGAEGLGDNSFALLYQYFPALHQKLVYTYESTIEPANSHNLLYDFRSGISKKLDYSFLTQGFSCSLGSDLLYSYMGRVAENNLIYRYTGDGQYPSNKGLEYSFLGVGVNNSLNYEYNGPPINKELLYHYYAGLSSYLNYEYTAEIAKAILYRYIYSEVTDIRIFIPEESTDHVIARWTYDEALADGLDIVYLIFKNGKLQLPEVIDKHAIIGGVKPRQFNKIEIVAAISGQEGLFVFTDTETILDHAKINWHPSVSDDVQYYKIKVDDEVVAYIDSATGEQITPAVS